MESKILVLSEKKSAVGLMIFGVAAPLILFFAILINDLRIENEHLLHNMLSVGLVGLAMMAVTVIPALLILRYRITFDFGRRVMTYAHPFKAKREISFDDIELSYKQENPKLPNYCYVFKTGGKRILKISEFDLNARLGAEGGMIRLLFRGKEKERLDWEIRYNGEVGLTANVDDYSADYPRKAVRIDRKGLSYHVTALPEGEHYHINVSKTEMDAKGRMIPTELERIRCPIDAVDRAIDSLVTKYKTL